jgi:ATP-dependent Clp protease ATP-binding subunit ClpC
VGEPGVGKRAIIRGLARAFADHSVPPDLSDRHIVALDLPVIVSGLKSRQLFEENLENIVADSQKRTSLIFVVEDLHQLATSKPLCLQVANVLKAAMLSGAVQCISTATPAEYEKAVAAERWLEQIFQIVQVKAPDQTQSLEILRGIKEHYERFHEVQYNDEALQYAVFHAHNYILQRNLPEKAIDLIDEAAAQVKLRRQRPPEIMEAQKRLRFIVDRMESAIANHEFEKARFYSDEERNLRDQLKHLFEKHGDAEKETVTRSDIEEIVSQWTGMPLAAIRASRLPGS